MPSSKAMVNILASGFSQTNAGKVKTFGIPRQFLCRNHEKMKHDIYTLSVSLAIIDNASLRIFDIYDSHEWRT